ncbi:tyrosine-type recombinase/integrase [Bremerella sp. P1]|uniref:tyrosine-type recombinase/integrase n=1 Tax=Bremerella sp. P1 TaxID=3026424 RepID=UPI002367FDB8|nr:tyrosine-type recombinase/integrase [Bremerella sp. P1]WDI39872.1 tyrosine-type recombinase/integrase [Bremerella sp. P1]
MSDSRTEGGKNPSDNVFDNIPVGKDEARLFGEYLGSSDLSANSQRAIVNDLRKFARWFVNANRETLTFARVTTRDITDFRDSLRDQGQAVATVNRALVSVRRYCRWLCEVGHLQMNPAKGVKELRMQELAPKGLDRAQVRRLFREVELRNDVRANAVFSFIIYTGCRVGDLVDLTLDDLLLSERSGTAVFRSGKGNKQRSVPVPLAARKALSAYLETRPPIEGDEVFVGERGPLSDKGVRCLCDKYSVICGFKIHPHLLRHTMAHKFLEDNPGDLVSLAQILGHENLNTTKRYVARTEQELADAAERMQF